MKCKKCENGKVVIDIHREHYTKLEYNEANDKWIEAYHELTDDVIEIKAYCSDCGRYFKINEDKYFEDGTIEILWDEPFEFKSN